MAWIDRRGGGYFRHCLAKDRSNTRRCQADSPLISEGSLEGCRTFHHRAERTARSMPIFRDREPYVKMRTRYAPFVLSGPMELLRPAIASGLVTRPSSPSAFTCTLKPLRMS